MNSSMKGLEEGRAKYAYDSVIEGSKLSEKQEYKSYVKRIPLLIKTNGLGSALAFVKSKNNKKPYRVIYQQITNWLLNNKKELIDLDTNDGDLIAKIITLDSVSYRALTQEILALFMWLKRFADGLIEGEE